MSLNRVILVTTIHLFCLSSACLSSDPNRPEIKILQMAADNDQIRKMMGYHLEVHDYNPQGYDDKKGGPVSSAKDLNCNFESPCCWVNDPTPFDQFDWKSVKGRTDRKLMETNFDGASPPDRNFIATSKSHAVSFTDNASFVACALDCTKEDIRVSLMHWRTAGTVLQVCQKDSFEADKPPANCQTIVAPDPGPSTVTLPNGQLIDIVVIASGFTDTNGGVVAVDNIAVEYTPCKNIRAADSVSPLCKTIACGFEGKNACGYATVESVNSEGRKSEFSIREGRVGNRETGVTGPADGTYYLASDVEPGTIAIAQSAEFSGPEPKQLHFKYFEAVDDFVLQLCKDDLNKCEDVSDAKVTRNDKRWKTFVSKIQSDTRRIFFVAKNFGTNRGVAGVDSIQLIDERTGESIC